MPGGRGRKTPDRRRRPKRVPKGKLLDETTIIRFGQMDFRHTKQQIRLCKAVKGFYGLSLLGANGYSPDETCKWVPFPNNWYCPVTVGYLRENGYDPFPEGKPPHVVVKWREMPADEELKRFISLFDEPQENPHPL